jgi:dynactin 1
LDLDICLQPTVASDDSELRVKLRVLETKRTDDGRRIRELEARLTDAEAFLSFKPKLQAKLQALQNEVATYKRELADMKIEQQASEGRMQDLSEQLEMAMLDKEVAEVRAEAAEADLEAEKELRAEKDVELSVFKQRLEGDVLALSGDTAAGADGGAKSALDYLQLERQVERLKEALIR